jgi:hypothetical protein
VSAGVEGAWLDSRVALLNSYTRAIRMDDQGWRWSGHARDRWRVGRLALEGGVRVTALDGMGFVEPRFSARWDDVSPVLGSWSARAAWGVYRQYVTQMELTNLAPSALVPDVRFWLQADAASAPPRARHLTFELLAEPWQGWTIRTESYYKWLDRILALDYSALGGPASTGSSPLDRADVVAAAEGRAFGAGVRVEHEGPRVRARVGYDWSVSERTFPSRFDGEREPAPWNEPHALSAAAELALARGLAVTASGRSVWGRTWALRRAYYDFLAPGSPGQVADGPTIGRPGGDTLPASHDVDVGLRWTGLLSGFRAVLHVDVRNVLHRQNVLDYSLWRTSSSGGTEYARLPRTLPGRSLLLSVRLGG